MVSRGDHLSHAVTLTVLVAIGLSVSFAIPAGIAASIIVPALVLRQRNWASSLASALAYYGAASWALVPAAVAFVGRDLSALTPIFLWCCAALLLASPWALVWSPDRSQFCWRVPVALTVTSIPPLGLIGWASPITAAGLLFPGTGWVGVVAAVIFSGVLAARPRPVLPILALAVLVAHTMYPGDPTPPIGWHGVNTNFDVSDTANPTAEYLRAQSIQRFVRMSDAHVVIFPESVITEWTEATDLFWQETTEFLRANGKTVLVGATAPMAPHKGLTRQSFDFSAELASLRGTAPMPEPFGNLGAQSASARAAPYRNTVIIRGAEFGAFDQRIPVPIGMWQPFTGVGVPLNLQASGTVQLAGKRAAVAHLLRTTPHLASAYRNRRES